MYGTCVIEVSDEVWGRYKATHNPEIRNSILMSYIYIVKCNAIRMSAVYRNHAELDEIVNHGILVLIDCIEKFDPSKGVKFETFASIRIRGSIIDYIRKQDWVPRNLRKKVKSIENCYAELQTKYGRKVTDAEVAKHLGIGIEELNKILKESNSFSVLSYEELLQENFPLFGDNYSSISTPEAQIQEDELKKIIAASLDVLNEKERIVISLYYYEELKLKEIAQVLEVTESRVSQIHSAALMKLKGRIKEYLNN